VVPGEHGVRELVIASSASNQVANFMRKTLDAATPQNVPRIVDAKPLPDDDSAGSSIPLLVQLLILGGSVGILGFRTVLPRFRPARAAACCRSPPSSHTRSRSGSP
jgi:hypothetical protein